MDEKGNCTRFMVMYSLLERLADEGYSLESRDKDGRSPLSFAAENGNQVVVQ